MFLCIVLMDWKRRLVYMSLLKQSVANVRNYSHEESIEDSRTEMLYISGDLFSASQMKPLAKTDSFMPLNF